LLFSILGHAQDYCSWTILHGDFGGYQFSSEIESVLKTAKENNIKKIDFTLKEYRNNNDSTDYSFTNFLCKYTNDSTLEVVKYYLHNDFCLLYGYKLIYKHGFFIPLSTFPVSDRVIKKYNCKDYFDDFKHKKQSGWIVSYYNDTIKIDVKKDGWTYGVQLKDSIDYRTIYTDSSIYYLDTNNRCIGINNDYQVNYLTKDSVKYRRIFSDSSIYTIVCLSSRKNVSKFQYTLTEKLTKSSSLYPEIEEGTTKTLYTIGKKGIPIKLKVIKAINDNHKVEGSIMTIKF
tara:strand:- start:114 stop:974 length:861 start_codon:yes stop_codon:yes gene_type:complete